MNEKKQICGTCEFHKYNFYHDDYMCRCDESEYCADWTDYKHTCDCWEEKK
jgi:hypothetical protein